jgi:acyl carrier protein phosphodiesterase
MNYLAHMLLSDGTPEGIVANLAGDFVRGVDLSSMAPFMQDGIALHRAVDRFTDAHPAVKQSRERLPMQWRHYRGVLVDVFYDHFLARHFDDYSPEPLEWFATRAYRALRLRHDSLPPRLQRVAPGMIEHDWLRAYASIEGLQLVLRGMSRRAKRDIALHQATADLALHYTEYEQDFRSFMPALVAFAAGQSM